MATESANLYRVGLLSLFLAVPGVSWGEAVKNVFAPAPERQDELTNLVRQDCGSCHGLHFEGGLGVPLTPAALEGKPVESLRDTILYGRSGTTMPPWKPFITEEEAGWIVHMLQKGLF